MALPKTKEYKELHKSWKEKADEKCLLVRGMRAISQQDVYLQGAKDLRMAALEALEIFSAMAVDEPVIYKNKVYVCLQDVTNLIDGLYAPQFKKNVPKKTPKKK